MAVVWGGLLFLLEDRVLAHSQRRAEVLKDQIRDRPPRTFNLANRNWLAGRDGRIYYYAVYDARQKTMYQVSVFDVARNPFRLLGHTSAAQISFRAARGTPPTAGCSGSALTAV